MTVLEPVSAPLSQAVATALERCVVHVAAHHGRPITLGALQNMLVSRDQTGIAAEVRGVIAAAEKGGLQVAFGQYPIRQIDAALMPAILLTTSGGAVVLHRCDAEMAVVHDPRSGEGLIDVPLVQLEQDMTGHALILKPEHRHAFDEISPGVRGHWFRDALAANRWAYVQVALSAMVINSLAMFILQNV